MRHKFPAMLTRTTFNKMHSLCNFAGSCMSEHWPIYLVHPQQLHQLPGLSFCMTRLCPIIESRCLSRRLSSNGTYTLLEFSNGLLGNSVIGGLNFWMVSVAWGGCIFPTGPTRTMTIKKYKWVIRVKFDMVLAVWCLLFPFNHCFL